MPSRRLRGVGVAAIAATAGLCPLMVATTGVAGAASPSNSQEITVAIVPKLLGAKIFEATVAGARAYAGQLHEKIVYTASVDANGADQAQVILGLVHSSNRPDVIAMSANDPTSEVPALEAARRVGIKVITFDSDVVPSARSYFIQDTAYGAMGEAVMKAVAAKAGPSATYAIMSSTPDATVQNAWISAMKSYAHKAYPHMKLVGVGYGQGNVATSESVAANLMTSHPGLKAIVPIDSNAMPGTLQAVTSQGLVGKVKVLGIADIDPNIQYFKTGALTELFLWDVVKQGELIDYVARGVWDGTIKGATPTFSAGNLGTFHVMTSPAPGTIIFSNPLTVTPQNYKEYNF